MTALLTVRPLTEPPDPDASWPRRWLFETNAWMSAPWFAKEYRYAVRTAPGGPTAATVMKVVADPTEYDAHNVRDLFALTSSVFPDQSASDTKPAVPPIPGEDRWFPNALVMFPGYISTVLTAHCDLREIELARTELLQELVLWARREDLRAVALPYVDRLDSTLASALDAAGFRSAPMTSRSHLTVPAGGFDDGYLASLPRRRAREIGREIRRLESRGVRTRREALDDSNIGDLLQLRVGLIEKYGHGVDRAKEATRLAWLASLGSVHVFAARQDGELLGFTLFLEHGQSWIGYMTGAKPADEGRLTYFDTTFYAPLRWIYETRRDVRAIDFGIGHPSAKRARGCVDHLLHGWIYAVDGELDRWLMATTERHREEAT